MALEDKASKAIEDSAVIDGIVNLTRQEFATYSMYRRKKEDLWIKLHHNFNAEYMASEGNDTTSKAFVGATRPRVMTGTSMLIPILMPPGQHPWTIEPTPLPEMQGPDAQGDEQMDLETKTQQLVKAAERAAKLKTLKIADNLEEGQHKRKIQDGLLECGLYGQAIYTGPYVMEKGIAREDHDPESLEGVLRAANIRPKYRADFDVESCWDVYPDPNARCVEECDSIIIRKVMSPSQLRLLRDNSAFDAEAVDYVLNTSPSGNYTRQHWESTLDQVNQNDPQRENRYEVYVRWGYINGKMLKASGFDIPDEELNSQIMCQVWVCGHKILFLGSSTLHKNRIPIYIVPWSRLPGSIWGVGIAEMMRDSQDAINACERAKMDNMALSSRPNIMVDMSRLPPGHNVLEVKAGKIWATVPSEIPSQQKAIEFITPDWRADQIQVVESSHMNFIQEQTNIPNNLMGMGGEGIHNRTASGASLQFNNAISALKGVVFNYETFYFIPFIEAMSRFVDTFDPIDVPGDTKVVAQGLSGLMHREAIAASLAQFMAMATQSPDMSKRIDPDRVFSILLKGSGLADAKITFSEQEYQQRLQAEQEQEATSRLAEQQMQQDMMKKQKAETAPNDALLQVYNETEDGTPLKTILGKKVLENFGELDAELAAAYDAQMKMDGIRAVGEAHQIGSDMANREEAPSKEMLQEMALRQKMKQMQETENEDMEDTDEVE